MTLAEGTIYKNDDESDHLQELLRTETERCRRTQRLRSGARVVKLGSPEVGRIHGRIQIEPHRELARDQERGHARSKQSAQEVHELYRNTKAQGHALQISKRE